MTFNLKAVAAHYGGTVSGNTASIPTTGHSKRDRGTSITLNPRAPDGVLVHVHNGNFNDALIVKDILRRDGFLPSWRQRRGLVGAPNSDSGSKLNQNAARLLKPLTSSDRAAHIWDASVPLIGTIGETYLIGRGLNLYEPRIASGEVLRFHPACPYGDAMRPCLVALFQNIRSFKPQAIQRIPLDIGGNRARNRHGEKLPKLSLGATQRAAIMLSHPYGSDSYFGICEGPETGLALLNAGERNIWALGGTSGIRAFEPVPHFGLVVFADSDRSGLDAARSVARRWSDAGCNAEIQFPALPDADFADILAEQAHE